MMQTSKTFGERVICGIDNISWRESGDYSVEFHRAVLSGDDAIHLTEGF
jgi:hypothetical protein